MRLFVSSVSEKYKVSACVNPLATLPCIQQLKKKEFKT